MRRLLLALVLAAAPAAAQRFRPADGPYTRDHVLVGSAPDGRVFARVGGRLGVTTDGETWTVVSETGAPRRLVAAFGGLLGAFPDGVRYSRDGGATWEPYGLDGLSVADLAADGEAFAVTETALYRRSFESGWAEVPLPPNTNLLSVVGAGGGTLAVGGYVPQCSGVLATPEFLVTRNLGATWTRTRGVGRLTGVAVRTDGIAYFSTGDLIGCANILNVGGLFALPVGAAEAVRVQTGAAGGVVLDAAGQPVVGISSLSAAVTSAGVALAGGRIVVGSSGVSECDIDPPCTFLPPSGLYTERAGAAVPTGFVRSEVRALGVLDGAPLVSSDGAVYRLAGGQLSVEAALGRVRAFVPVRPATVLAVSPGQEVPPPPFIGSGGISLPSVAVLGDAAGFESYPYGLAAASAAVVADRLLLAGAEFYRGTGIYVVEPGEASRLTLDARDIATVAVVSPSTAYAGAVDSTWVPHFGPEEPPAARIFRSDDAGDTWVPNGDGLTARNVYAFATAGPNGVDIAGTSGGVFVRTRVPGAPWLPAGLDARSVYTFAQTPDGMVAGTDDGLFLRGSNFSWTRYGTGLDGRAVYAVLAATDDQGSWIGVGTDAGLFQTRAFGVASETAPAGAAALSVAAYPNPLAGRGTVRVSSAARVEVFDLLGRRVADLGLVRGEAPFDASGLPAGLYVVRARSGRDVATVRAVVRR